jgi:hypothetical protein
VHVLNLREAKCEIEIARFIEQKGGYWRVVSNLAYAGPSQLARFIAPFTGAVSFRLSFIPG